MYLQYARSVNKPQKRDCQCYASTSFGGLQIHAVDIRFPNNTLGICDDNENSYLQFDAANQSIQCRDKQLIGGYATIFNTTKQNIEILLHLDGNPHSVWIGITGTIKSCLGNHTYIYVFFNIRIYVADTFVLSTVNN